MTNPPPKLYDVRLHYDQSDVNPVDLQVDSGKCLLYVSYKGTTFRFWYSSENLRNPGNGRVQHYVEHSPTVTPIP